MVFVPNVTVAGMDVAVTVMFVPKQLVVLMAVVAVADSVESDVLVMPVKTGLRSSISYVHHRSPSTLPVACCPETASVVLPKSYMSTESPEGVAPVRMY